MIQLKPGNIVWLKEREEIEDNDINDDESSDDGFFDHPVVILRTNQAKKEATVLNITSFGNTPLKVKHKRKAFVRLQYLPIAPSPPHPDNQRLLKVEGEQLHKPSYVCIRQARTLSFAVFRSYGRRKLNDASYNTLLVCASSIEVLNFVPATRTTSTTPTVTRPYTDPSSLWTSYSSNVDLEAGHIGTVRPSSPALPSVFHSTPRRTQGERIGIVPYRNLITTPTLQSHLYGRYYGTIVSPTPGRRPDSDSNKKPSILAAVLNLCIFVGVILASTYLGYMGISALFRWIWFEIQGTWCGKAIAWTAQAISWSTKSVFGFAKVIFNWIRHRL